MPYQTEWYSISWWKLGLYQHSSFNGQVFLFIFLKLYLKRKIWRSHPRHVMGAFTNGSRKKKKNLIRMEQGLLLWSLHFTRQRTNTPFPLKNEMARAGPTASKAPVSPNVKLIYPLIKWKTIEMSARVIQPRRIANMATEQAFLSSFTKSGAVFRNDIMDDYVYIRETGFHFIIGYLSSSFVDVVFSSTVQCFCFVFET